MIYQLSADEWEELERLSKEVRSAPVMLVGDVDLSRLARDNVDRYWNKLGRKYGFAAASVRPADASQRKIAAAPSKSKGAGPS